MMALNYNTYDMFSRGPMSDMMEFQALNRMCVIMFRVIWFNLILTELKSEAKALSYAVQQHLDAARSHVPEIPHPGSLNVIQGNFLLNMMFDNLMMDMIMQGE